MKTTTASQDPALFQKIQEIIREIDIAMMTTVTPDGALRSRPMVTADFSDDGQIWFFTSDDSEKAHDLSEEHGVNLSYSDPGSHRYVSVTGNATVVHDDERASDLWDDKLSAFFPRGLDDPHLALICVRIETAEFWDFGAANKRRRGGGQEAKAGGAQNGNGDDDGEHHAKVDIRATPSSG